VTGLRSTLVKFTAFATAAVLLFAMLYATMTNSVDGETREWTARFSVVSGLREGDDVRVAGVKVGRVEEIEVVDNDQARVRFRLREDQKVYQATRLTLRYQNLLGQRYLALTAGQDRGAELSPEQEIPASRTSPGFDLTALLNGFEPLFDAMEPGEVNRFAGNILAVLQGEGGTVETLLQQTADVTGLLADKDAVFAQVLANLTPVLRNLSEESSRFDSTVVQLRALMTGLAEQRTTFASSIDNLGRLVETTSSLLDEVRPDLRRDVHSLRQVAGTLARERARLGRTVDQLPVLLSAFARAFSYGGMMNVYLCNLGFEAAGATAWVPSSGGPYSEACR
jgi:phospholipid/cholesterol/gamma-HCH transport system substrate-binding protein